MSSAARVLRRFIAAQHRCAAAVPPLLGKLGYMELAGMFDGRPVTLYHGTTKLFRHFDMSRSRDALVDRFYGKGIFLTPDKHVAEAYADANRNIGFDPSIIQDLRRRNRGAGEFLQALYDHGRDGWERYLREHGFERENPVAGEGTIDFDAFQKHLGGVDSNTLGDIAGYILGSATKPLGGDDETLNIFNVSTGAPPWIYKSLDDVGLDSKVYRPKVYTVTVTVSNPLVTKSKSQARKARQLGHDSVIYYGSDLVQGVPEVAVFDPRGVRVRKIEIVS